MGRRARTRWMTRGAARMQAADRSQSSSSTADASVDLADFNDWLSSAPGAGWAGGDFNGDGTQDLADFNTWLTTDIPTAPNALLTPEPSTLALLGLGGLLALRRRLSGDQGQRQRDRPHLGFR